MKKPRRRRYWIRRNLEDTVIWDEKDGDDAFVVTDFWLYKEAKEVFGLNLKPGERALIEFRTAKVIRRIPDKDVNQ